MQPDDNHYRKAIKLEEIDNAVRFDVPVAADHPFFTEFSDVRGDFEDKMIYRTLNVNPNTYEFNTAANQGNKTLLFLAGMRGSGKTSELAKFAKKLHSPKGFFVVTCNLDTGLDLNNLEYMDVLIFQLEQLFEKLNEADLQIEEPIVASLQKWFSERVEEVNRAIRSESGFEVSVEAGTPSIFSFLKLTSKVKASIQGSKDNADKIRTVFKNNFTDFARQVNTFFEEVNRKLRGNNKAQELLFIIDGIEKTATPDIRRKVILDESNRIRQIRANTIFTLPIELMPESPRLTAFATVVSFPFVKICERDGSICDAAVKRFFDFTYKRIDERLFDNADTVREAILLGGGSPREYLRILEYASFHADDARGVIDRSALDKGVKRLAAQTSQYVSKEDLDKLRELKTANEQGKLMPYDEGWQDLLEKLIVLEYNDGTYKRVNPIVAHSALYQQNVG